MSVSPDVSSTTWPDASPVDGPALDVVAAAAPLGTYARGVDLRAPLCAQDLRRLQEALDRRLVVVFRGQALDDGQHERLASQLGRLLPQPIAALRGECGPVTVVRDGGARKPGNAAWHSDLSWLREPPGLAVLRAVRIPERGGDTLWADMYAAWEALPAAWRRRLATLRALHDFDPAVGRRLERLDGAPVRQRIRHAFPPVAHPVARTHPRTGRVALFVSEAFTSAIVGVSADESREILQFLFEHTRNPTWQLRHRWREGDVVIWDERATVHFAMADHYPAEREVRRVTIAGERPA